MGDDGWGRGAPARLTAVEGLLKRATNLHSLHVADDVIKHDITLSPSFSQKAQPADGTTRKMTTSEECVEGSLREGR